MSIRTKTLRITGITFLCLVVTISVFSMKILLDGLNTFESERVQINTERIGEAIDSQLGYLRNKSSDWAYWDDTYNFIVDHNRQYVATNLVPETFGNLNVDSIVYLDNAGTPVYAKTYDPKIGGSVGAPASLIARTQLIRETLLTAPLGTDVTGLILLPEGPMYITVRQILHSDNTGPVRGVLLFGKNLDQKEITRLSGITKTILEVHRIDEPSNAHDAQMAKQLSANKSFAITILSGTQIAGYMLRKDVNHTNILLFDVVQNRDLYLEGLRSLGILFAGFVGAGVIFFIVVSFVLGHSVISPIVALRQDADRVSKSGDIHARLTETQSNDEFDFLTKDLNTMLQSLEDTQKLLISEQKKSQAYIDIVGVMIVAISSDQRILLLNKRGSELLEVGPTEAIGKNWFTLFIPEDKREEVKAVFDKIMRGEVTGQGSYENEVVTGTGKRRLIAWRNTAIRNENGEIIGTLNSGEDITETHMSQEKILARSRELEELNKAMIGRELKMTELKKQIDIQTKEISELKARLGQSS